ncbi:hypothetical protein CC2G_001693 [Coprinopsis cinerea AmutBmut pab1-1]|nr:hypothetical protein CC2G_001693 [Coprinopsis cinerea AmutBmut pab1-1]
MSQGRLYLQKLSNATLYWYTEEALVNQSDRHAVPELRTPHKYKGHHDGRMLPPQASTMLGATGELGGYHAHRFTLVI